MSAENKKLVITVVNVVIFVCNAIISFVGGNTVAEVATVGSAILLSGAVV